MPKHQIFLVHGMGQFERGWSASTAKLLTKVFGAFPVPKAIRLDDAFDFPEITYSKVFDKWRSQWKADAASIAGQLATGGLVSSIADDLGNVATSASGNNFLQTHVLDVLFWRFIRQMAEEVTLEVLTQIDQHLKTFGNEPVEYSVICHSLGTSVMYESMHAGLTDTKPLLSSRLPDHFVAVANCARLLWGKGGDIYATQMGPSPFNHKGMCNRFLDFGHALDPVWQISPFHDPPNSWFPEPALRERTYYHDVIPTEDIQDPNVHSLAHYLSHPAVHVPLIRSFIGDESAVTPDQYEHALDAWRADRLGKKALKDAKQKLNALGQPQQDDWNAIAATFVKLRQTIAGAKPADGEN